MRPSAPAGATVKLTVEHGTTPAVGTELVTPSGRRYLVAKVGGLRLRQSELEEPIRGELVLLDDTGAHLSFKRPMKVAHLYQQTTGWQDGRQDATKPLFDAHVLRIEGDVITLAGLELESTTGGERVYEHAQVWRCTVVRPAEAPASP